MVAYNVASLISTGVILPLLGVVAVVLRFYVRLSLRRTYIGVDDWLIVLAVVLVLGQGANQIVGAVIGELGRDDQPTVKWRVTNEGRIDYAVLVFEKVTYCAIKLSVLFFYRRIFYHQKPFRIANDVLIVLTSLWGVVFMFAQIFVCGANSHHGHPCAPQSWLSLWFAITEVLGDIAILVLPYPCIRKLQMSRRDKVGLGAIFFLGWLSAVFGIIRLAFVTKTFAFYIHPKENATSPHRTPPSFWTTAQVAMGVFAACLPPLGPLIRKSPSPKKIYSAMRSSLSTPFRGSISASERLRSTERSMEKGQYSQSSQGSGQSMKMIQDLEQQLREAQVREDALKRKLAARHQNFSRTGSGMLPRHEGVSPLGPGIREVLEDKRVSNLSAFPFEGRS